jgi:hypothetical protein
VSSDQIIAARFMREQVNPGIQNGIRAVKLIMEAALKPSQELFFGGSADLSLGTAHFHHRKHGTPDAWSADVSPAWRA